MEGLIPLLFIILMIFSSVATKMKEKKELERRNASRRDRQGTSKGRSDTTRRVMYGNKPTRASGDQVRTARPKGAGPATRTKENVAPGKQLLETLLGEINQEVDDWIPVGTKTSKESPLPPLQKSHQEHSHENVREQAKVTREKHAAEVARSRSSQPPAVRAQRSTPSELDPQRERRRQEILAERERRKQARREQQQKSQRAARQQSAQSRKPKRTAAPQASNRYAHWLHSKNTVRNAIVLSEILGPPKSFMEDDQRII